MAKKDYYEILWIGKNASEAEIKKAYRKKAMEWHPDKHKWDKNAEAKFVEINEAYSTLKDSKKRKQYDTFWSSWSQFEWFSNWWQWFSGFEDIFSQFGWRQRRSQSQNIEFDDLFEMFWNQWKWTSQQYKEPRQAQKPEEIPNVDVIKTYEVPIMDLILWTKIDIETVYSEHLKLKIPEGTKSWTKFKIKWKWRKIWTQMWDLYIIIDAKMPKNIPDDVRKLLESIKYRL